MHQMNEWRIRPNIACITVIVMYNKRNYTYINCISCVVVEHLHLFISLGRRDGCAAAPSAQRTCRTGSLQNITNT